mmetsp:Transcript_34194/g.72811  ORF Transcript_34194/g.72811 Transcript_34194/m.72811 type:complete len:86 (+) Transcript_34194:507-764(+)
MFKNRSHGKKHTAYGACKWRLAGENLRCEFCQVNDANNANNAMDAGDAGISVSMAIHGGPAERWLIYRLVGDEEMTLRPTRANWG